MQHPKARDDRRKERAQRLYRKRKLNPRQGMGEHQSRGLMMRRRREQHGRRHRHRQRKADMHDIAQAGRARANQHQRAAGDGQRQQQRQQSEAGHGARSRITCEAALAARSNKDGSIAEAMVRNAAAKAGTSANFQRRSSLAPDSDWVACRK